VKKYKYSHACFIVLLDVVGLMCMSSPVVLGIYGTSDTGKTTLISDLISCLISKGIRCGSVKCSEKHMNFDTRGKDTWVHANAGALVVGFSSHHETVYLQKHERTEQQIIRELCSFVELDVVLIEGARDPLIPKIRIGDIQKRDYTMFQYDDNIDKILQYILKQVEKVHLMSDICIKVNGKEVPITEFPSDIISNAICGMIQSLKGVDDIHSVDIHINRE